MNRDLVKMASCSITLSQMQFAEAVFKNIAVLLPLGTGLITGAAWTQAGYGEVSAAQGILLSVYLSILFASFFFLSFATQGLLPRFYRYR